MGTLEFVIKLVEIVVPQIVTAVGMVAAHRNGSAAALAIPEGVRLVQRDEPTPGADNALNGALPSNVGADPYAKGGPQG